MDQESSAAEKRIAEDKELILQELRDNAIVQLACQKAEIGRSTYYRYRQQDPEFAQKADEALRDGALLMNDMAESYLLSAIKSKNMSAISMWLKAHHPTYANKLELSGTIKQVREELTAEEQAVVQEALHLAAIVKKEGIKKLNEQNENQQNSGPESTGNDL